MTQHEMILIENFSRGLLQNTEAAIYSSCQNLRKRLKANGEVLSFDEAFKIWKDYIGDPILNMLSTNPEIYSLLGKDRYKLFFIILEKVQDNNYMFSEEIVLDSCRLLSKKMIVA